MVVPTHVPDEVVARLDADLRAAVRRDGLDPQHEVASVRRLATDLVRAHDERSLTGAVAPVGDAGAVVAELVARVAGFGPSSTTRPSRRCGSTAPTGCSWPGRGVMS